MDTQLTTQQSQGEVLRQDLLASFLLRYDAPNTRESYERDLTEFLGADELYQPEAQDVSFQDINQHIRYLQEERGLAASTVRRKKSAICSLFKWLEALEVIGRNPANPELLRNVKKTGNAKRQVVFLSEGEVEAMLETCDDTASKSSLRDKVLIMVLVNCVLRRSEAAAMNFEHLKRLGEYWVLNIPNSKGGEDQMVKVPDHVAKALLRMKEHYGYDSGAVWRSFSPRNRGERVTDDTIREIVKRVGERTGLDRQIGAHVMRHTGCTIALENGANVKQVQTMARHKNLETTMGYLHQNDALGNSASDKINVGA